MTALSQDSLAVQRFWKTIQTAILKNHVRSNTPIFTFFFSYNFGIRFYIVFSFWRVAITAFLDFLEGQPPKNKQVYPKGFPDHDQCSRIPQMVDEPTVKKTNIYQRPLIQQIYSKHVTIHFLPSGNLT